MKAVIHTKFGPPEVLKVKEIDKPIPKDNEVLIKIGATTVTKYDCWVRNFSLPIRLIALLFGVNYGIRKPKNPILGTEFAGKIEAIGKDVRNFKVGDKVFGCSGMSIGSCAEYICMDDKSVLGLKPENMSIEEASSVLYGGLTALYFLRAAKIKENQKVLIFGASGGVGVYAEQLAKYFGCEVTGVCSTSKTELVKSLGADHIIDYTKEDFTQNGEKYDIIFDTVGKCQFSKSLKSLNDKGKLLLATHKLPMYFRILWQNLTRKKKVISPLLKESKKDLLYLRELIEKGQLKSVVDKIYQPEEIVDAHRYVESGKKKGNVVIKFNDL